jgi:hypothetical protein
VGMDHCEAIRNAAQACGTLDSATRVVDCIVHVERNMIRHQNLIVVRGATSASKQHDCDDANLEETENTPTPKKKKVDGAKKIFLNAAREDVRMLSTITDRDIFERGVQVVLADWRYHNQHAFADWFESVYLSDAWDNGAFFAGAGDRPG